MSILRSIYRIKGLSRIKVRMSELKPGDVIEIFEPDNNEFLGTFMVLYQLYEMGVTVDIAPFVVKSINASVI